MSLDYKMLNDALIAGDVSASLQEADREHHSPQLVTQEVSE